MMMIDVNGMQISLDEKTLSLSVKKGNQIWKFREDAKLRMECEEATVYFEDAQTISHKEFVSGVGRGIQSHYEGFEVNGQQVPYAFDTIVWVEYASGNVFFEWIPLCEEGLTIKRVYWPGEMEFEEAKDSWYSLLNWQQGILLPNTWETEVKNIVFDGFFETAGGYMPWYSQIRDREGYIAICLTPWNAGWHVEHPENGPYTHVGMHFEPSLGKMDYRRIVRYTFLEDCDHNDMCKVYRAYVKEEGRLRTLAEKAIQNPTINDLIGCAFVHKGIKTSVQHNSSFYDPENPHKNDNLVTFEQRAKEMRELHELGVKKLYLHLDGWAQPGYDNQHPDYYPICEEAGGTEGMKSLVDTMHELGYLFGIHDQYRDYYLAAETYDEHYACQLADGTIPGHDRWAGGPQTYLCGTQAPYYVKRNFGYLEEKGIQLDGAYLDVFTCNEGDECANPYHRMTRRDCYDYRELCFRYLLSKDILPSSEEVSDWCVPSMVMCHYAPYEFMMEKPGTPKKGIPVPLFNLVYHDCLIEPWMMDKVSENEDYMLYAVLNGGAPYIVRDGAYPNTDGSFDGGVKFTLEEQRDRCKIVSDLHEKVAKCELVRHELVDGNAQVQRSVFSDGTTVTVDFENQTYVID